MELYLNVNITLQCDSCGEPTNCRIGMSNRAVQPLRFACQTCGQVIDLTIRATSADIAGAVQIETLDPFDEETKFVDLHLDFPVTFEKYVMGQTPFMRAAQRIGSEDMQLHELRLSYLDDHHDDQRVFAILLKHYARGKTTPFKSVAKRKFDIEVDSDKPEDSNAALYNLLANVMWPFALPEENKNSVDLFLAATLPIHDKSKMAFERFMANILDTGFLTTLQHDCLSIYPRILGAELVLRPALFLDFDHDYKTAALAMRVSTDDFQAYKDLYKDLAEIISRQFVLVAAINNLLKRADHDAFLPRIGLTKSGKDYTPVNLNEFAKIDFGRKLGFIDDTWYEMQDGTADNQLRNAIAHFKTEYDDISQIITYYPRKDGLESSAPKTVSFLEFMRRVLIAYREMHRLHHLIKALFYYQFLFIDRKNDGN
jgi:hypothetical protein